MSRDRNAHPAEYWQDLEKDVAERVRAGMACNADDRLPIIMHLRDLEQTVRTGSARRETIQVIASGRRLLGDRSNVGPVEGPFLNWRAPAP